MECISAKEAAKRLEEGKACLVDVRSAGEFASGHAQGAINIPLHQISTEKLKQLDNPSGNYMLICQHGGRSRQACAKVSALGGHLLANVEGGTASWRAANLPMAYAERRVIPLDRQVRIIAGFMVLAGTLLGLLNPVWLAVPAFVGAGLVFAGITDRCGVTLLLLNLPWNKGCSCPSAKSAE